MGGGSGGYSVHAWENGLMRKKAVFEGAAKCEKR